MDHLPAVARRVAETGVDAAVALQHQYRAPRRQAHPETGYVWINNSSQHFMGAPFGRIKNSGIGREECFAELLEFTYTKNVNLKLG